jgi:hypothetical protein
MRVGLHVLGASIIREGEKQHHSIITQLASIVHQS